MTGPGVPRTVLGGFVAAPPAGRSRARRSSGSRRSNQGRALAGVLAVAAVLLLDLGPTGVALPAGPPSARATVVAGSPSSLGTPVPGRPSAPSVRSGAPSGAPRAPLPLLAPGRFGADPYVRQITRSLSALGPGGRVGPAQSGTPVWLAYDSVNQTLWLAADPSSVDEFAWSSIDYWFSLVAVVPVGLDPFGVAVDNQTNTVFVANTGSNNVTAINASSAKPIASIPVGIGPTGLAFDPIGGDVFVADGGSGTVSVIASANLSVTATLMVGTDPIGVAVDPVDGSVFVANNGSDNVSVLSATRSAVVRSVPVGSGPFGAAWDNASDEVYVTNDGSANVTVINASSDREVDAIPLLVPGQNVSLEGIAYEGSEHEMWIAAGQPYTVVVNTTDDAVLGWISNDPSGAAWDPAVNQVCLTNTYNASFDCIRGVEGIGTPPDDVMPVTFSETGLPSGGRWDLLVNNLSGRSSTSTEQTLYLADGIGANDYYVNVTSGDGCVATPGEFVIDPTSTTGSRSVNFSGCLPAVFAVAFNESGLPATAAWSVTVDNVTLGSSGTTLALSEPNGTYRFRVTDAVGATPTPANGSFRVRGQRVAVAIAFAFPTYAISFSEAGLPSGDRWSVDATSGPSGATLPAANGTAPSGLELPLRNGSYSVAVLSPDLRYHTRRNLSLEIDGGNVRPSGATSVIFVPFESLVEFLPVGLPEDDRWTVAFNGSTWSSTGTIEANATNGSYAFQVTPPPGWTAHPQAGTVTVNGSAPPPVVVTLLPVPSYPITFEESGLPAGANWSVSIGGTSASSTSRNATLEEPNGTYPFLVRSPAGYRASSPGFATVNGSPVLVAVSFAPVTYAVSFAESGLPTGTTWGVTVTNGTGGSIGVAGATSALGTDLPNGTYTLSVAPEAGYRAASSATGFEVRGAAAIGPSITFSPISAVVPSAARPPPPFPWGTVLLAAVGAAVAGVVVAVAWRRRTGRDR